MEFSRLDDLDSNGNPRVTYTMTLAGSTFAVICTKYGVQLTGTTPFLTDQVELNRVLVWAHYQSQRLKEAGHPINQNLLERGEYF